MKKGKILISACLLGEACRYDGGDNKKLFPEEITKQYDFVPVCPEVEGGLPTPRPPAEIQGKKVVNCEGKDVTEEFERGARIALKKAKEEKVAFAILKAKSPSCGKGLVYDGSFQRKLVEGHGKAVELLLKEGYEVYTEISIWDKE